MSLFGNIFPVLGLMCTSLFCLSVYILWYLANTAYINSQSGRNGVLLLWRKVGCVETISLHWL